MTHLRYSFKILYTLALFSIVAGGCRHKELDDVAEPDFRVRVKYDWEKAPQADPDNMSVFFYNPETGMSEFEVFSGNEMEEGKLVNLEAGNWKMTTFNVIESGIFSDSNESHHVSTREGDVLEGALGNGISRADDETVRITPDMLWGESRERLRVNPTPGDKEFLVTLYPEELICHYSFEIRNVDNLSHVTNLCASLSGMSGGLDLNSAEVDMESITLPLEAAPDGSNTIRGEFLTFGYHPLMDTPKIMRLYVWLDDGRKLVYGSEGTGKWNVTNQILNAEDPRHVHYIIDGLGLPTPMDGSPFDPSADDWVSEEYEVGI